MKEKYSKPYAEIETFKSMEILTASGYPDDNEPDTDIEVPW